MYCVQYNSKVQYCTVLHNSLQYSVQFCTVHNFSVSFELLYSTVQQWTVLYNNILYRCTVKQYSTAMYSKIVNHEQCNVVLYNILHYYINELFLLFSSPLKIHSFCFRKLFTKFWKRKESVLINWTQRKKISSLQSIITEKTRKTAKNALKMRILDNGPFYFSV